MAGSLLRQVLQGGCHQKEVVWGGGGRGGRGRGDGRRVGVTGGGTMLQVKRGDAYAQFISPRSLRGWILRLEP